MCCHGYLSQLLPERAVVALQQLTPNLHHILNWVYCHGQLNNKTIPKLTINMNVNITNYTVDIWNYIKLMCNIPGEKMGWSSDWRRCLGRQWRSVGGQQFGEYRQQTQSPWLHQGGRQWTLWDQDLQSDRSAVETSGGGEQADVIKLVSSGNGGTYSSLQLLYSRWNAHGCI